MLMSLPVQMEQNPVAQLMLYITEECNLRCSYCFVNKQPRTMSLETGRQAVDYFLQPEVSGGRARLDLNFFGGEPFLCPELVREIVRYGRERAGERLRFAATTNGTLAGPEVEKAVREGQMNLLISVDGDASSHAFRPKTGGGDSWPHVCRNVRKLTSWSPGAAIRMTYHPGSYNLLDKVQAVLELGGRWIVLSPVPEADWSGHEEALEAEMERLGDWFLAEFEAGRDAPLEMHWRFLVEHILHLDEDVRPSKACALGDSLIAIDTAGNVLPCHRYLYRKVERFGSVRSLRGFPKDRQKYVHLGRPEIPDCATCEANKVCAGGCRVVAQDAGYGLLGVHPNHCLFTRAHMRQVLRIFARLREHPRFLSAVTHYMQMPLTFQEAQPMHFSDSK